MNRLINGKSNLIYCFAGAIYSPQRGTQCADKIIIIRKVKGRSRSVIRGCGCDQEGRKLSWEKLINTFILLENVDNGTRNRTIWIQKYFKGVFYHLHLKAILDEWSLAEVYALAECSFYFLGQLK